MRTLKKMLTALLLISMSANTALAQTSCQEVIQKADAALAAKNAEIKKLELGLTQSTGRIADLQAQVQERDRSLQSWYHNPIIVGILGLAAGVAVIEFVKK